MTTRMARRASSPVRTARIGVSLAAALIAALVLVLVLKLSIGPATASAATYYVDSQRGDDAVGRPTAARPWRSLARLDGVRLGPGDIVKLRSGSRWREQLKLATDGIDGRPVRVTHYGEGRLPVITGVADCVVISGAYVHVAGIAADRCGNAGFAISGYRDAVRRNRATRSAIGIFAMGSSRRAVISRNYIARNNKMIALTKRPKWDDSGAFGVLLHGTSADVGYNTIVGQSAFSYDFGRDGSAIEVYGAKRSRIHHNRSTDNLTFVEMGDSETSDTMISRNTIRSTKPRYSGMITRGAEERFGPVRRTTFTGNRVLLSGHDSIGFVCAAGCGPEIAVITDNYFDVNGSGGFADHPPRISGNTFVDGQLEIESEN